jgi:lipopolysaccharide/colanic/teichoic acid biosynthesis glycosyltransferase
MDQKADRISRIINVSAAILLMVVTLPLWLVVAILIKLTSRGPVFYTQTRIGIDRREVLPPGTPPDPRRQQDLGGGPFAIYKFRTMRVDAERESGEVWASQGDTRVTLLGRILRRLRIDELPQVINVVKGEMNLVGPRPERPRLFANLRTQIPGYQLRQRVRPGITGLAQIRRSYDASIDDVRLKVQLDLEYIADWSLWNDIEIMLETIPVVLLRRGGW